MSRKHFPAAAIILALLVGAAGLFVLQRVVSGIHGNKTAVSATAKTAHSAAKRSAQIERILVEKRIIVKGSRGLRGGKGPKGSRGKTGARGKTGRTGSTGAPGRDGLDGAAGAQGPQGAQGQAGKDGAAGASGQNGTNGVDGAPGEQGPAGTAPGALTCAQSDPDTPGLFTCVAAQ